VSFNRQLIEIKNLPILKSQFQQRIKAADPVIEQVKCIFGYKDSTVIYAYTAFDFIDKYQDIITQGQLEKFYIFQPFDNS